MRKYFIFVYILLCLTASCLSRLSYAEQAVNYAILYPQVREEYERIFLDIIQGIEQTANRPVYVRKLDNNSNPEQLEKEFHSKNIDLVVALGSHSYQFSTQFDNPPPILVSATRDTVDHFSSLSLAPSPQMMLDKLSRLAPKIKTVTVIYNPKYNQWFVQQAALAAKQYGLTLQSIEVSSIKEATQKYTDFFDEVNPETDALLLPLDATSVNEKITVPLVLTRAWEQRVLVFSCNPLHAKRGALFSVYPDNQRIGQDIGDLIDAEAKQYQRKIYPMRRGIFALNTKTIKHLSLNVSETLQSEFELHFPAR